MPPINYLTALLPSFCGADKVFNGCPEAVWGLTHILISWTVFFKARNAIDRFLHRLGWQLKGIFQLNDVEHYEDFSFSFYHRRNFHRLLKFSVPISLCDGNKSVELLHDFFSSSTRQAMIMNVIGRKVIKRWQILLWLQFRLLGESVSLVPGMKIISQLLGLFRKVSKLFATITRLLMKCLLMARKQAGIIQ